MAEGQNAERRPTRFSVRPPARFVTGADFTLWIQRVELYFKAAEIPDEKKGQELVSLLEDDAFRIVSQIGLLSADRVETRVRSGEDLSSKAVLTGGSGTRVAASTTRGATKERRVFNCFCWKVADAC